MVDQVLGTICQQNYDFMENEALSIIKARLLVSCRISVASLLSFSM